MATRRKTGTTLSTTGTRARTTARARPAPAKDKARLDNVSRGADYEGARQLLSRYCQHIDHGRLVELAELFHPQARFSVSFDSTPVHVGRAAILAWYTMFFRSRPRVRHPRHKIFEPCLTMTGNTATASTYFDSDFVEGNGEVTVLAGRYDDVLIKIRGRWYFKERTITICYHFSPGKGREGMKD